MGGIPCLGGLEKGVATIIGGDNAMATDDDDIDRLGGFASGNPRVPWASLFLVKDSKTGNYMQRLMPKAPDLFMLFLFIDVGFLFSVCFLFLSFFCFFFLIPVLVEDRAILASAPPIAPPAPPPVLAPVDAGTGGREVGVRSPAQP